MFPIYVICDVEVILLILKFSSGSQIIIGVFVAMLFGLLLIIMLRTLELTYVLKYRRPYFVYVPLFLKRLNEAHLRVLRDEFRFYNKLSPKHKRYFEHRVASFIRDKHFIGRENLKVTDEMKVLISATAVMLTFGFRDFYIGLIDKIFIYPEVFYSNQNESYHKGELNPKLKALVLSWSDFVKGFSIKSDNINLGIHEFAHAIHLNSIKEKDISSTIFSDSFKELTSLLAENETLRKDLIDSKYFREYAFTNQYEFVAVIIETFIETPQEFRSQFPEVYEKTKQMLNFRFADY